MDCKKVMRLLPGYLDGALPAGNGVGTHVMMGKHLELCSDCREELQRYAQLSSWMSRVERAAPPADLALRIRVMAAQRLSDRAWLHCLLRGALAWHWWYLSWYRICSAWAHLFAPLATMRPLICFSRHGSRRSRRFP